MSSRPRHRRRKTKDHRRGKSVEEISKEALMIIVDENDIDSFGAIGEDEEQDTMPLEHNPMLRLSVTSKDSMDIILDDIESELSPQYPSPPDIATPDKGMNPLRSGSRSRSDSHYNASTPLVVKKYTNFQLDSLVKNKKPELIKSDELPLLNDITDEDERRDILLQKLSLCEIICDFRIVNGLYDFDGKELSSITDEEKEKMDLKIGNEIKAIENKKILLGEIIKYLTKNKWSSIFVLQQIFRVVQTNLFRSLPDAFIIEEFQGIDKPTKYTLPSWSHLQLIYELMFQVIMNKDIEKKTLSTYLSGSFLNNFVQLFHSLSRAEVDYVKILLHSMYLDFISLRDEIRISISQYCWDFIYYNNGTPDGINAILDIMNSILQGLDDDKLNDPEKWYIVLCHVLCPLHKGKKFDKFEQTLYKCIQTFIKSKPEHFVVVFNHGLLKFWPKTNPNKEHIFVKEILNILKMVKRSTILCNDKFTDIFQCVIERIRKNLLSQHYKIVDETIESFKEKLMRQCIEYHGGENGWKGIYKSLIYVTNNHYLYLTRDNSKQIMDWLKKYRITKKYVQLFEKLENEHTANELQIIDVNIIGQQSESDKIRQQKWKPLLIMAQNNKKKMLQLQQSSNIDSDDIKQIEQIFDTIQSNENDLAQSYIDSNIANINDHHHHHHHTSFNYPMINNKRRKSKEVIINDDKKDGIHTHLSPNRNRSGSVHRKTNSQPPTNTERMILSNLPTPKQVVHKKRASQLENDYGYPTVHNAFKQYRDDKNTNCRNPTHLVLFAKKKGIKGVSFANTNKYFKARKTALQTKMAQNATKRSSVKSKSRPKQSRQGTKRRESKPMKPTPSVPSSIRTQNINSGTINNKPLSKNDNVSKYRRSKKVPTVTSPIIASIKNEKKIDEELSKEVLNATRNNKYDKTTTTKKGILSTPKHESQGSGDLPYWSILNIGTPKELQGNQLKMAEIKEDVDDKTVSADFHSYAKQNNIDLEKKPKRNRSNTGSTTPATPGSIKSCPMTPTSSYWAALDSSTLNLNSLVAETDISLKK